MNKSILCLLLMIGIMASDVAKADQAQIIGAGLGAVMGGVVGNSIGRGDTQVITTTTGVLVGGMVGSEIGKSVGRADNRGAAYGGSSYDSGSGLYPQSRPNDYTPNYVAPPDISPTSITPAFAEGRTVCEHTTYLVKRGTQYYAHQGMMCLWNDGRWHVVQ